MQGRKLHKVTRRKISSHDSHVHSDNKMPTNTNTPPAGDTSDGGASLLLDEIRKWKATGIPMEYFSVNQAAYQDVDRNAEVKSTMVSYVYRLLYD